jgi:hypothetical protein
MEIEPFALQLDGVVVDENEICAYDIDILNKLKIIRIKFLIINKFNQS